MPVAEPCLGHVDRQYPISHNDQAVDHESLSYSRNKLTVIHPMKSSTLELLMKDCKYALLKSSAKSSYFWRRLHCWGARLHIEAVLFDLFDTLLLIEGSEDDDNEDFYKPSLGKLHEVLVRNGVDVPFEEFSRAYFDVRDRFYAETRQSLEEPHMTVRLAQTMRKLGYDFDASDRVMASASEAFAEEFMRARLRRRHGES
jgi:hypothetical protein